MRVKRAEFARTGVWPAGHVSPQGGSKGTGKAGGKKGSFLAFWNDSSVEQAPGQDLGDGSGHMGMLDTVDKKPLKKCSSASGLPSNTRAWSVTTASMASITARNSATGSC